MNIGEYSFRRLTGTTFLAWFAVLGFDFLLHGGLLARLYTEPSPFLLPPEDAFRLIPLGYVSFLIFEVFLIWLLIRLEIRGSKSGFLLGLKVGASVWGALALGLLSISTAGFGFWPLRPVVRRFEPILLKPAGFRSASPTPARHPMRWH